MKSIESPTSLRVSNPDVWYTRPFFLLTLLSILVRLPGILRDLPPWTFGDEDLVTHLGFSMFQNGRWQPTFYRFGGFNFYYPLLILKFVRAVFGVDFTITGYVLGCRVLMTLLLSSLGSGLTYLAAFEFWKDRRASWVAGLLMALSPMALGLNRNAYPDQYLVFFPCLLLFLAGRYLNALESAHSPPNIRNMVLGMGAVIGIASAAKYYSVFFAMIPCLLLLFTQLQSSKRSSGWRAIFRSTWPSFGLLFVSLVVTFLLFNPFLFLDFGKFRGDFQFNVQHYKSGHWGLESEHGHWFYFQVLYLTSFGVLSVIPYLLGVIKGSAIAYKKTILLVLVPVVFIALLGRYRVVVNRNVASLIPFVFILASLGWLELHKFLTTRVGRFATLALLGLFLGEPVIKTTYALINDFNQDTREASAEWTRLHIPSGKSIGVTATEWGNPIDQVHHAIRLPFPAFAVPDRCLDYYVMDGWLYETLGPGKSMYLEMVYSQIVFINPTQQPPPGNFREKQDRFLADFNLVKSFGRGYYGPYINIYQSKVPCS